MREERVEQRVRAFEVRQALDLERNFLLRLLLGVRARFGRQAVDFDGDIHRKCR